MKFLAENNDCVRGEGIYVDFEDGKKFFITCHFNSKVVWLEDFFLVFFSGSRSTHLKWVSIEKIKETVEGIVLSASKKEKMLNGRNSSINKSNMMSLKGIDFEKFYIAFKEGEKMVFERKLLNMEKRIEELDSEIVKLSERKRAIICEFENCKKKKE